MRGRPTWGEWLGLLLMLSLVIGLAALRPRARPIAGGQAPKHWAPAAVRPASPEVDCAKLITPEQIGREAFERYGIAEKLRNNEFVAQEFRGYVVCALGQPSFEHDPLWLDADIYYMFDPGRGDLVLTRLAWDEGSVERRAFQTPTPQPTEALPAGDTVTTTVCIDSEMPIIEVGGENPQPWHVWDLLSRGQCHVQMGGQLCWDCGPDLPWRWLVPPPGGEGAEAAPGSEGSGRGCLDASMVARISGQELGEEEAARLANDQCDVQLGGGQFCFHCPGEQPEPTPTPAPTQAATRDPQCTEYMMPEVIGQEAWEKYGIAGWLASNQFQRAIGQDPDSIICYGHRMIGEVHIGYDELYYRFDIESGELLSERIHWREDLPEPLPTPRISRQEAEALVQGEVSDTWLYKLGPDEWQFETSPSSYEALCWIVWSTKQGRTDTVWATFINAMTGEVLAHFPP